MAPLSDRSIYWMLRFALSLTCLLIVIWGAVLLFGVWMYEGFVIWGVGMWGGGQVPVQTCAHVEANGPTHFAF